MVTPEYNDAIDSILVPTDGSDAARAALARAIAIAEPLECSVHVLAVVDTSAAPRRFNVEFVDELEREKGRIVDEIVASVDDSDVDVTGTVRRGRPADEILAYADEIDTDVIAIGRTGRSGVEELLLGSTTDRVVRAASVPVLVVPSTPATNDDTGRLDEI